MKKLLRVIFDTSLIALALCIVVYGFNTGGLAFAHPQEDCFNRSACDYVQVETPGGGAKMVYVCE